MEALYREHRDSVYRYLLKLCGNELLAEELTQETFYRAYMNIKKLRSSEAVSGWLSRIAKNAYLSWYSEQKRLLPLDETRVAEDSDPMELFAEKAQAATAFRCLHRLEEPYKEVFLLAVFAQLPLKEISLLFGKSESWARVTLLRARQKLIKGMEDIKV